MPCMATLCHFSPCITRAPWVLCAASSPAPPVAWGVGVDGKDMGAWERCGCPAVAATRGSAGAGQEQGEGTTSTRGLGAASPDVGAPSSSAGCFTEASLARGTR